MKQFHVLCRRGISLVLCLALLTGLGVSPLAARYGYENKTRLVTAARSLLQQQAVPESYLDTSCYGLTQTQLSTLKTFAGTLQAGTTVQTIRSIALWVAENVYYDYRTYLGVTDLGQDPYSVYTSGLAICYGYTDLTACLLRLAGIPCITIYGTVPSQNHGTHHWLAAWTGSRWLYLDPTWMSQNVDFDGVNRTTGTVDTAWFDYSASQEAEKREFEFPADCLVWVGSCQYTVTLDWDSLELVYSLRGSLWNFKTVAVSGSFSDVPEGAWYAQSLAAVCGLGLMSGDGDGCFRPEDTVTLAEAIKLAALVHSTYAGISPFTATTPWYQTYVDYALAQGILQAGELTNLTRSATRAELVYLMANSLPESALRIIHGSHTTIPDYAAGAKYFPQAIRLYQAGVLTGTDAWGSLSPNSTVTRAETAVLLHRLVVESARK